MWLRLLVAGLALLVGLPMAWRLWQSPQVQAWWRPPADMARPIIFDNGTVRQPPAPASGPLVDVSPGLKKCRRGERVIYTDSWCPEGTTPVAIERGTVNVVKPTAPVASAPAGAAPASGAAASDPNRRRNIRDVLDVSRQPSLYDQQVERAAASR